jgi:hypothetical protein
LETNPGETINFARDPSYAKIRETLKAELMANLAGRGLTPLRQDRAIDSVRALETKKSNRTGRAKVKAEIDE